MSLDDVPRYTMRPGLLARSEEEARETVEELRGKAEAGNCTRRERTRLRHALGLLRRHRGYSPLEIKLRLRDGW